MARFFLLLSLGLAWLSQSANGFGIDPSCETGSDPDFMHRAVQAAVDLAAQAVRVMDESPRQEGVERLLDLLFRGGEGHRQDPTEADLMAKVRRVFKGVENFNTDRGMSGSGRLERTAKQVNIFCNLERVQRSPKLLGPFVDTSTGIAISKFSRGALDACDAHRLTLAFTWNPYWVEDENGKLFYPSQITICPWFYEWALDHDVKFGKQLNVKGSFGRYIINRSEAKNWPFTEIDTMHVLEKVLLHEFTHTIACGGTDGFGTDDVDMASEGAPFFKNGYGWKAATALARQQQQRFAGGDTSADSWDVGPANNADSFALFGSGVDLLLETPPVEIQEDGRLRSVNPSGSKRSVPRALRYRQTPAAFERFITMIRADWEAAPTAVGA